MQEFERHVKAMFDLVKAYAEREGIPDQTSILLIVRKVDPNTGAPVWLAAIGEPAPIALGTCHATIDVLTREALREHAAQHRRTPTA